MGTAIDVWEEMSALRFENLLAPLTEGGQKKRIRDALVNSIIESEDELKNTVSGNTKPEVTALFQLPPLELQLYDASALAGVVIQQQIIEQLPHGN